MTYTSRGLHAFYVIIIAALCVFQLFMLQSQAEIVHKNQKQELENFQVTRNVKSQLQGKHRKYIAYLKLRHPDLYHSWVIILFCVFN